MGFQIRVLQKGKITIPVEVRKRLGLKEGDVLTLDLAGGRLILLPPKTVANPTQLLSGLVKGLRVEEPVDEELRRAAASGVERKLRGSA